MIDGTVVGDSDIPLLQTSLDWILGIEQVLDLLQAPASSLHEEEVDDNYAEGVPYNIEEVESPARPSDGDRGYVSVHDFDGVIHEPQVGEALGSRVVGEDLAWVERLHGSLKRSQPGRRKNTGIISEHTHANAKTTKKI
jgi:hypothetical protein